MHAIRARIINRKRSLSGKANVFYVNQKRYAKIIAIANKVETKAMKNRRKKRQAMNLIRLFLKACCYVYIPDFRFTSLLSFEVLWSRSN